MREVAIAAAKDSATMRVIAAVTLFFLPPTFVAVSSRVVCFKGHAKLIRSPDLLQHLVFRLQADESWRSHV